MLGPAGRPSSCWGSMPIRKRPRSRTCCPTPQLHGMLHAWHFLTGSLPQLRKVWKDYGIQAAVQGGQIAHTPALFVIDTHGRLAQAVHDPAVLRRRRPARPASGPGDVEPPPRAPGGALGIPATRRSPGIEPSGAADAARGRRRHVAPGARAPARVGVLRHLGSADHRPGRRAGGGSSRYSAPGRPEGPPAARCGRRGQRRAARRAGPASWAPCPIRSPTRSPWTAAGASADGYEVQGLPWLMLVSATGRIAWYYSVAALGWPRRRILMADVRDALAHAASPPGQRGHGGRTVTRITARAPGAAPAGRPAPGRRPALAARLEALRGHPVVINSWASWCPAVPG